MSRSALDTPRPLLPDASPVGGRAMRWTLPVALLLSAAPFVVAGIRVAGQLGAGFRDAGDQAVFGVAVHDASTLHQLLGPYSRFGWSHPGPSWFYLLAPFYRALGGSDAALVGANTILNGLFAAAVVAAVHRAGRPTLTLVTSGLVLAFVLRMPAVFFVQIWNPFVLCLAVALFLVLAVRVRDGRWNNLLLLLIAGSFLVQTHVGTAPLVGLVGLAGLIAFVLGRRAARRTAAAGGAGPVDGATQDDRTGELRVADGQRGPRGPRRWYGTTGLAVVLVAMWALPVYQQVTSPLSQGNLGRLAHFFLFQGEQGPHPTVHQSVIAVGRLLAMAPYGWGPGPYEMDLTRLPASVGLGLAAQVVAFIGLVIAGRRWHSTSAAWTGVVTLVALVASIAGMHSVTGTVFWYLELWVSAIPLVTVIGLAQLIWDRTVVAEAGMRWTSAGWWDRSPVAALAISLLLVAGSVAAGVSLTRAVAQVQVSPGVQAVSRLLDHALAGRRSAPVKVDIATHDFWPLGAGVVQDLLQEGDDVRVGPQNADLFGTGRATTADEPVEITLIDPADKAVPDLVRDGNAVLGTVDTEFGRADVLLRTSG